MFCAARRPSSTPQLVDLGIAARSAVGRSLPARPPVHGGHRVDSVVEHATQLPRPSHTASERGRWTVEVVDVRDVLETMHHLESAAIAAGADAITVRQLSEARAVNEELSGCGTVTAVAIALARRFHRSLLSSCPNARMLELLGASVPGGTAVLQESATRGSHVGRVVAEHDMILDLLVSGAPRYTIEHVLREHAQTSELCRLGYCGG